MTRSVSFTANEIRDVLNLLLGEKHFDVPSNHNRKYVIEKLRVVESELTRDIENLVVGAMDRYAPSHMLVQLYDDHTEK